MGIKLKIIFFLILWKVLLGYFSSGNAQVVSSKIGSYDIEISNDHIVEVFYQDEETFIGVKASLEVITRSVNEKDWTVIGKLEPDKFISEQYSSSLSNILKKVIFEQNRLFVIMDDKKVYASDDFGKTFYYHSDTDSILNSSSLNYSIEINNSAETFLVTGNSKFYTYNSASKSWSLRSSLVLNANTNDYKFQLLNDSIFYAFNKSSTLFKSTNKGQSWISSQLPQIPINSSSLGINWNSVDEGVYSNLVAIYKTFEGGESWIVENSSEIRQRADGFILQYVSFNQIIAYSEEEPTKLKLSINGGLTFETLPNNDLMKMPIKEIRQHSTSTYSLVDNNESLFTLNTTSRNVEFQASKLLTISFNDNKHFFVSETGTFYVFNAVKDQNRSLINKSTNKGLTWSQVETPPSLYEIQLTSSKGKYVWLNTVSYDYTNKAPTRNSIFRFDLETEELVLLKEFQISGSNFSYANASEMEITSKESGYIIVEKRGIYRVSSDWDNAENKLLLFAPSSHWKKMSFNSDSIGWLTSIGTDVLFTNKSGTDLFDSANGIPNPLQVIFLRDEGEFSLVDIVANNNETAFVLRKSGSITVVTKKRDLDSRSYLLTNKFRGQGPKKITRLKNTYFLTGDNGMVYISQKPEEEWTEVNFNFETKDVFDRIQFANDSTVYLTSSSNLNYVEVVFKPAEVDTTSIDSDDDNEDDSDDAIPTQTKLYPNYPNPFNPSTTIRVDLSSESSISLQVYNSLGQFVRELVNEKKPAGFYEIPFNASGLSSGVYYYRLQTGNLVETKKMLLIK